MVTADEAPAGRLADTARIARAGMQGNAPTVTARSGQVVVAGIGLAITTGVEHRTITMLRTVIDGLDRATTTGEVTAMIETVENMVARLATVTGLDRVSMGTTTE